MTAPADYPPRQILPGQGDYPGWENLRAPPEGFDRFWFTVAGVLFVWERREALCAHQRWGFGRAERDAWKGRLAPEPSPRIA